MVTSHSNPFAFIQSLDELVLRVRGCNNSRISRITSVSQTETGHQLVGVHRPVSHPLVTVNNNNNTSGLLWIRASESSGDSFIRPITDDSAQKVIRDPVSTGRFAAAISAPQITKRTLTFERKRLLLMEMATNSRTISRLRIKRKKLLVQSFASLM